MLGSMFALYNHGFKACQYVCSTIFSFVQIQGLSQPQLLQDMPVSACAGGLACRQQQSHLITWVMFFVTFVNLLPARYLNDV